MTNPLPLPGRVTIGDRTYLLGQVPARTQFHVVRRMGPVVATASSRDPLLMSAALANMSDDDVDYVLNACLAAVQVLDGDRAQPLFNAGKLQYADVTMPQQLLITSEVLKGFAGDFFVVLAAVLNTGNDSGTTTAAAEGTS